MVMTTPMAQIPVRPPTAPVGIAPLRSRYLLVVLLPVVAFAVAVVWGVYAAGAVDEMANGWARADVPGQVVVDGNPGTWYVHQEGTLSEPTIRVLGPDGSPVTVVSQEATEVSMFGGSSGSVIATFQVPTGETPGGSYTIVAESADRQGSFSVTDVDVAGWERPQLIAMLVLLLVNAGAAVAIGVVPALRWRRGTRTSAPTS
jgi:hypothetical protein